MWLPVGSVIIAMMYGSPRCPLLFAPASFCHSLTPTITTKIQCPASLNSQSGTYRVLFTALTLKPFRQSLHSFISCHQVRLAIQSAGMLYCRKMRRSFSKDAAKAFRRGWNEGKADRNFHTIINYLFLTGGKGFKRIILCANYNYRYCTSDRCVIYGLSCLTA